MFNSHFFKRVAIVGVGMIGGSIGMAIKKNRLARHVVGISQKQSSLAHALKNHAIDEASHDVKKAVQGADLVILSTPVSIIIENLVELGPHLSRNCIVTDVGSTKQSIVYAAEKNLPDHVLFVGSHPLAGSEKSGAAYATADLFKNSICVMTPTAKTNRLANEKVKVLWSKIGAVVKTLSPQDHDKILASVSHLPHLIAYALMSTVPASASEYLTPSLKEMTRIAGSSPNMWRDISLANDRSIVEALDEFIKNLSSYRKAIISRDQENLLEYFKKSKTTRDSLEKDFDAPKHETKQ